MTDIFRSMAVCSLNIAGISVSVFLTYASVGAWFTDPILFERELALTNVGTPAVSHYVISFMWQDGHLERP